MSHTVTQGITPNLQVLTYYGFLEAEELLISEELRLNEVEPIYLLVDISHMNSALPDRFLESVLKSYVVHPNLAHLAVYVTSPVLRMAAGMVTKITRQQKRLTIHDSYASAEQCLLEAMRQHA